MFNYKISSIIFYLKHKHIALNAAVCGIYPEKLASFQNQFKDIKKNWPQFDRQQNSELYSEFSWLKVEICRFDTLSKSGKLRILNVILVFFDISIGLQ